MHMAMAVRERQTDAVPHRPDVKVKDAWLRRRIATHLASFYYVRIGYVLAPCVAHGKCSRIPAAACTRRRQVMGAR